MQPTSCQERGLVSLKGFKRNVSEVSDVTFVPYLQNGVYLRECATRDVRYNELQLYSYLNSSSLKFLPPANKVAGR